MGQMPVLEIDGKKVHQSLSICRYLAKKVGLDGKTDYENFEIDSVADTVNDLRMSTTSSVVSRWNSFYLFPEIAAVAYEADPKVQEEKRKVLNGETLPFYLEKLEEIAKENNGYLALKRLTWADVYFTGLYEYLNFLTKQDLTAKHPNLKKVTTNVFAIDSIKNWVAKRPVTDM